MFTEKKNGSKSGHKYILAGNLEKIHELSEVLEQPMNEVGRGFRERVAAVKVELSTLKKVV